MSWQIEPRTIELAFELPRGAFATAVLHELSQMPGTRRSGARIELQSRRSARRASSTYTAPVPPSTGRADTNATTGAMRRSQ